jgi:WhiB family redox-sensing transcriptional regulator
MLDAADSLGIRAAQWLDDALCARSSHPEWWFNPEGDVDNATRTCARCSVRTECLEYAVANRIDEGIWGGESARARRQITRRRKRLASQSSANTAPRQG